MQIHQNNNVLIITNNPPIRSHNVYSMLILEWGLMAYYVYIFTSIMNCAISYQSRMLIYCIVFLLFEKLDVTYKYIEFQDPLQLMGSSKCIKYGIYLCIFNLTILLIRIIIDNHNLQAFIMFIHFLIYIIMFFSDNNIIVDQNNIFSKIITPALLFMFNKTSQSSLQQFWFIQFLIFVINLFLTIEIQRLVLLKECQYFGWKSIEENGKSKQYWNKGKALKTIIIICCFLIVTQNLLLIFDNIKYEISVTLIHTFLISIFSYLLYIDFLPLKK